MITPYRKWKGRSPLGLLHIEVGQAYPLCSSLFPCSKQVSNSYTQVLKTQTCCYMQTHRTHIINKRMFLLFHFLSIELVWLYQKQSGLLWKHLTMAIIWKDWNNRKFSFLLLITLQSSPMILTKFWDIQRGERVGWGERTPDREGRLGGECQRETGHQW